MLVCWLICKSWGGKEKGGQEERVFDAIHLNQNEAIGCCVVGGSFLSRLITRQGYTDGANMVSAQNTGCHLDRNSVKKKDLDF